MSKSDRVITARLSTQLCYYINPTNKIQLIRVIKDRCLDDGAYAPSSALQTEEAKPLVSLAPDGERRVAPASRRDFASERSCGSHRCLSLEKIVFPQQRILFEAMPEAQLEIYNSCSEKLEITQVISCENLKIN